jgi:hypothetical protein
MSHFRYLLLVAVTTLFTTLWACREDVSDANPAGAYTNARVSAFTIPVPNRPSGVFINQTNLPLAAAVAPEVDEFILSSSTCDGTNLVIPWNKVNPSNGTYNWDYVTQEATKWWTAGKRVNLLFWSSAETTGQQFGPGNSELMYPGWVLTPTTSNTANWVENVGRDNRIVKVPVFYRNNFKSKWKTFITAAMAEFSKSKYNRGGGMGIGYLRFGVGVGAESYPANFMFISGGPVATANFNKWRARGYSELVWNNYVTEILDHVQASRVPNSPRQIQVTLNVAAGNNGIQYDSLPNLLVNKCLEHKFGIGTQGMVEDAASGDCYADWCTRFNAIKRLPATQRIPTEGQTAGQSSPTSATNNMTGQLTPIIETALANGVQLLELYPQEWFVAYDPDYIVPAAKRTEYRNLLETTHSKLRQGSGN